MGGGLAKFSPDGGTSQSPPGKKPCLGNEAVMNKPNTSLNKDASKIKTCAELGCQHLHPEIMEICKITGNILDKQVSPIREIVKFMSPNCRLVNFWEVSCRINERWQLCRWLTFVYFFFLFFCLFVCLFLFLFCFVVRFDHGKKKKKFLKMVYCNPWANSLHDHKQTTTFTLFFFFGHKAAHNTTFQ